MAFDTRRRGVRDRHGAAERGVYRFLRRGAGIPARSSASRSWRRDRGQPRRARAGRDEVTLTRRLTRSQLASFPSAPEYAAESGGSPGAQPVPEREEGDGADEQEREPETAPAQDGGELWYASPDGTLSRFDGRHMLVALPSENARVPDWAKGVVQMINGREYVVFPR